MDLFERTGKVAIGSRLRMLTDRITTEAASIYHQYGVDLKPKWFPVLFVLAEGVECTITGIAKAIGQTHPSVSNIVREMTAAGLVKSTSGTDKRSNNLALSRKGKHIATQVNELCLDVDWAIGEILQEARHDLWKALGEWEDALSEKSLLQRVKEARRRRERQEIRIVPYEPQYQPVFRDLNAQWISAHWTLEEHDIESLEHPQETILDKGGYIFVALRKGSPVGVCALCTTEIPAYDFELAKLAVSPEAQGLGIGTLLCEAAIAKAREQNARKLYLESNTLLKPAIHTYRKLGFKELEEQHFAYDRGNIQMELLLI